MKKIKFLLLGIVSILGIGFSSANITFFKRPGSISSFQVPSGISDQFFSGCVLFRDSNDLVSVGSSVSSSTNIKPYVLACGNLSFNNLGSSTSFSPDGIFDYSSNFVSDFFPYYYDGLVVADDFELSGSVYVDSWGNGNFYIGDNSCIYITSATFNGVNICDLENSSNCYSPYNFEYTLMCGDGFSYKNNTRYSKNFSYVVFKIPDPSSGGDTPQDFETPVQGGIRDYNTMLIEKAILCYMSDGAFGGEYGDCDGINYSGFINQYNPSYTTWSGSSIEDYYGQLLFTNAQPVLSNYCVNTDLIQYPFCSQLDLYSGAYLLYFFENGKLDYYVLGDGFGVDLGNLGSGQLGELTCQGAWCDNITQGLPEYIFPTNSGNTNDFGLSGDIISEDFYKDFIDKGFRFSCPYSYSGSYFVIGKDLINRLGGRDLMIPINCFISAFSMGSKMLLFGDPQYGAYWSGSLFSGDTPGHQRLFLFFDLILSIGIVFVLFKLYNLFTSKK